MNLNRNNYEAYVLDYLDGNLDPVQVSELLLFLEQHPDLRLEAEQLMGAVPFETSNIEFNGKDQLKKPVFSEVRGELVDQLIARFEGDLSPADDASLKRSLVIYPELARDEALIAKTRLHPDLSVVFPEKAELKKRGAVVTISFGQAWRAAAAVAVFGLLAVFFTTRTPDPVAPVASVEKESPGITHIDSRPAGAMAEMKKPAVETKYHSHKASDHSQVPAAAERMLSESFASAHEVIAPRGIAMDALPGQRLDIPELARAQAWVVPAPQAQEPDAFKGIPQLASEKLRESVSGVVVEENKPAEARTSAFTDMGLLLVKLYNKATGDEAKVVRRYDTSGQVVGYVIVANHFEFGRGQ